MITRRGLNKAKARNRLEAVEICREVRRVPTMAKLATNIVLARCVVLQE